MVSGIGSTGNGKSILRAINSAEKDRQNAFTRLSSGKRVNSAKDDAAGLAIISALEADVVQQSQIQRNVGDFQSLVDIADGAVGQISDITTRLQELSVQSANGTLSDQQRSSLNNEFQALKSEIGRIAQTTEFNGQKPLAGGSQSAQVGTDNTANSQITVSGIDINSLVSQINSLDISTAANAQSALTAVQDFSSSVTSARGNLGAASARLETARRNAEESEITSAQAAAQIRDADVAEEAAKLVAASIRSQGGVALSAQANQQASTVLQLLK